MSNKKALASVVATSLLIVIAVVAVSGFQGWVNFYSSKTFAEMENHHDNFETIMKVEAIIGNELYINSKKNFSLNKLKIIDSKEVIVCEFTKSVLTKLNENAVLLMNFDNGTATDLSEYRNDGSLGGNIEFTENNCISKGCFKFDGDSDYIKIPHSNSLLFDNDTSFSLWVYPFSIIDSTDYMGFKVDTAWGKSGNGFSFSLPNYQTVRFGFFNEDELPFASHYYNTNYNLTNKHKHLVFTFKKNDSISIYVDGKLKSKINLNLTSIDSNSSLFLGSTTPNCINGTLDEIGIYSKSLTSEEVKELYFSQKAKIFDFDFYNGTTKFDIKGCNLKTGEKYNIVIFTDNQKIEQEVIAR